MKIIEHIYFKICLGQIPDNEFFHNLLLSNEFQDEEINKYKIRWESLVSFSFLHLEDFNPLLEVQGHNLQALDIISLNSKKLHLSDLNLLEWKSLLHYLCLKEKIAWNNSQPFVSFNSIIINRPCRVTLLHESLSGTSQLHPKFFIRFHFLEIIPLINFLPKKDSEQLTTLLKDAISKTQSNLIICGPTGSGKTSLMKSLTQYVSQQDHIVTIEDTAELFLQHPRITSLITQKDDPVNSSSSLEDLCSYALRITPDRLILGEIRGKEIISLALMINTGHRGVLTTVHASSAVNALQRLTTLFCLYQKENSNFNYNTSLKFLAQQFQLVVYMEKREIKEIIKIIAADQDNLFYERLYQCDENILNL